MIFPVAARGADFTAVCQAADKLRRRVCGEDVTYVVNRNINYTNVCTYKCTFCAFRWADWLWQPFICTCALENGVDGREEGGFHDGI